MHKGYMNSVPYYRRLSEHPLEFGIFEGEGWKYAEDILNPHWLIYYFSEIVFLFLYYFVIFMPGCCKSCDLQNVNF